MKKSDILWNVLLLSSLVGYFMLMKLLGFYEILSLRYINLAIHFGIIYLAMNAYRSHIREKAFSFWDTAMVGVRSTVPAVLVFALFQFFYLRFIDPPFMGYIQSTAPMGQYLTPAFVMLGLMAEGMLGAFFNSYVGMRLIAAQEHAPFPRM